MSVVHEPKFFCGPWSSGPMNVYGVFLWPDAKLLLLRMVRSDSTLLCHIHHLIRVINLRDAIKPIDRSEPRTMHCIPGPV